MGSGHGETGVEGSLLEDYAAITSRKRAFIIALHAGRLCLTAQAARDIIANIIDFVGKLVVKASDAKHWFLHSKHPYLKKLRAAADNAKVFSVVLLNLFAPPVLSTPSGALPSENFQAFGQCRRLRPRARRLQLQGCKLRAGGL